MKLGKVFFISLQNLFPFSRKSNFRTLDIQISWHHQMPTHKTRNTLCWITWEVNTVCQWNLASLCHITEEKILSKTSTKIAARKLVPDLFFLQRIKHSLYWKMKFLSKLLILDMCISKTVNSCPNQHTNLRRFLFTEDSLKIQKSLELVYRPHFS